LLKKAEAAELETLVKEIGAP